MTTRCKADESLMEIGWKFNGKSTDIGRKINGCWTKFQRKINGSQTENWWTSDEMVAWRTALRMPRRCKVPVSFVVMADVTQRPKHSEACVSSTTMAKGNAMNVTLQLGMLWCCKLRQHCNSKHCGIATCGTTNCSGVAAHDAAGLQRCDNVAALQLVVQWWCYDTTIRGVTAMLWRDDPIIINVGIIL